MLVPTRVLAPVPGSGTLPFGQALALKDPALSRAAFSDLVGVTVDAGWVLGSTELAALVDQVGGVRSTWTWTSREGPKRRHGRRGRRRQRTTPRRRGGGGVRDLPGPGEQEVGRLPRLQKVLEALLGALPPSDAAVAALVGSSARLRQTRSRRRRWPDAGRAAAAPSAGRLSVDTLPVLPLDTGGGELTYRVDPQAVRALVDRTPGREPPRQRCRRTPPGAGAQRGGHARALARPARTCSWTTGWRSPARPTPARLDYAASVVLVPDTSAASRVLGERVATALGLPAVGGPGGAARGRRSPTWS